MAPREFYDLRLNSSNLDGLTTKERISVAISLGYHVQTISHYASISTLAGRDRCSIPKVESPQEIVLPKSQLNVKPARKGARLQCNSSAVATLKQISRITLLLDNPHDAHQLLSRSQGILRSYDLMAVLVASEKAFQFSCTVLDVDIITLDFASRLPFKMKHDVVKQAIDRGVVFEVPYAEFIRLPAGARRQQFLANVQALAQATGGNSIVFSSAAETSFDIRSPYDVVNMATFMGLQEEQAYDSVSNTPGRVLVRAFKRRHKGQSAVTSIAIEEQALFDPKNDNEGEVVMADAHQSLF
eukprot:jgi/Picsp_1/1287/NSC_04768-R1_ribonuclease p protein subunit p30